jgi:hypothetical protein
MIVQNLVTFGSCLSRYVARSYKRLFAGNILASVYHNRSDYFVSRFIKGEDVIDNIDELSYLKKQSTESLDEDVLNILLNQTAQGIGKHKIDGGLGLFNTISKSRVDLIFIDNFMDVSARLSSGDSHSLFLRPQDYLNYHDFFRIGEYLPPVQSADNFLRVIDFFKRSCPGAQIVFFHFPFNTYVDDASRKARSMEFAEIFKPNDVFVIQPQSIPKIYRTSISSHFEEPQYAAYAGMISALVRPSYFKIG